MSTQIKKKKEREKKMLNLVDAGKRYHVKKGDEVRVLAGENRGKRGKIREIISGNDRAILQSLDDGPAALKGYKQHKKRSNDLPNGAIVDQDPSIHISNLMLATVWDNSNRAKPQAQPKAKEEAAEAPKEEPIAEDTEESVEEVTDEAPAGGDEKEEEK